MKERAICTSVGLVGDRQAGHANDVLALALQSAPARAQIYCQPESGQLAPNGGSGENKESSANRSQRARARANEQEIVEENEEQRREAAAEDRLGVHDLTTTNTRN